MEKIAIIETGGKQYKVTEGQIISIEKMKGEYKEGDKIVFDSVLLKSDGEKTEIGEPKLKTDVEGKIESIDRKKKVITIKYKAKSNRSKKSGHRQPFFKVKITSIK